MLKSRKHEEEDALLKFSEGISEKHHTALKDAGLIMAGEVVPGNVRRHSTYAVVIFS